MPINYPADLRQQAKESGGTLCSLAVTGFEYQFIATDEERREIEAYMYTFIWKRNRQKPEVL